VSPVGARIMVIEDNVMNMELMTYLLKSFGHTVLAHYDSDRAVELVRKHQPDLVICDIQLPGVDGYQIARQLKADATLAKIPLIAVTAYAMVGDRDKLLAAGFDGYISKPIEPSRFVPEVQEYLRPEQRQEDPIPHPTSSSSQRVESPGTRGRVLVVDDSAVNLNLMRTLLEPSGYEVQTADSVNEGLRMARQSRPDLIVTDVHMPGRSGCELAQALSEDPQLHSIPCILISSTGLDLEARNQALSVGAKLIILRPIEPQDLLAEVERHIANGAAK
jgi:two-component system cell cycle response regulator